MRTENITSWQNASLKRLRKAVNDDDYCMVEGSKLVQEFLAAKLELEFIVVDQSSLSSHESFLAQAALSDTRILTVPENLFRKLAETVTNQGMIACGKIPAYSDVRSLEKNNIKLIVCDAIQDPGNLGAIFRSALAFSADGAVILPGCVNPFSSKCIRASAGAVFHLPLYKAGYETVFSSLQKVGIPLYALDANSDSVILEVEVESLALVIGNEGHGLSDPVKQTIVKSVSIPLNQKSESLNAAVAASVAMYELFRKKGTKI